MGDKTIAFWLMDKEMYTHMSDIYFNPNDAGAAVINRCVAEREREREREIEGERGDGG